MDRINEYLKEESLEVNDLILLSYILDDFDGYFRLASLKKLF